MADQIKVNELDFDSIKDNLKHFLKSQSQFKDFDFDGASINVLLDVLAYNTHYNSFYANMVANEMFLDTAQLRDSVVSRAKMLGYTPRSMAASSITCRIELKVPTTTSPMPTSIVVPRYTKYKTVIDGTTYFYTTVDDHTAVQVRTEGGNHIYSTVNVRLYEGNKITQKYVYDANNPSQRFVIPNNNVDTSTLKVRVQRSATNQSTTAFNLTRSITGLNGDSAVYFLQEIEKELYEVYFGDGNVGRALEQSNIIYLDYLTTSGPDANGASSFKFTTPIEGFEQEIVLSEGNTKSSGGAERESVESIRYLAPLNYNAQNRVVTSTDYKTTILQNYADVQAVSSWGGEENDPPFYGKVFIALKPKSGLTINEVAKEEIKDSILKSRNVVTITPEIVDPVYMFIQPQIEVFFNREVGAYSAADIEQDVKAAVLQYSETKLEQFQSYFRYSQFLRTIDESNPAIENSTISLKLATKITVTPNQTRSYAFNYSNPVFHPHEGHFGSITTTTFSYGTDTQCFLSDDGDGVINVYKLVVGERRLIDTNIGTIDYTKGTINLSQFAPVGEDDTSLTIMIVPREQDIFSVRNQILEILEEDIVANATDSLNRYNAQVNTIYTNNTIQITPTGSSY